MSATDVIDRAADAPTRERLVPRMPRSPTAAPKPNSAQASSLTLACPVEALGRELAALGDAYDEIDKRATKASGVDCDILLEQRDRIDDYETRLQTYASTLLARSPSGAMLHVAIAANALAWIDDACRDVPHLQAQALEASRCLYSVLRVLEAVSGVPGEAVGARRLMDRHLDPHDAVARWVKGDFRSSAEVYKSSVKQPTQRVAPSFAYADDPLAALVRDCWTEIQAFDEAGLLRNDEDAAWQEHVGRRLDLMASADCPECTSYAGALDALRFMDAWNDHMEPRDRCLISRVLDGLEQIYPDRLYDREQPENADGDLVELGKQHRAAHLAWLEFEPTYRWAGDGREALLRTGKGIHCPEAEPYEQAISKGNDLMDREADLALAIMKARPYSAVGLKVQAAALRAQFHDAIAVVDDDRDENTQLLISFLDSVAAFDGPPLTRSVKIGLDGPLMPAMVAYEKARAAFEGHSAVGPEKERLEARFLSASRVLEQRAEALSRKATSLSEARFAAKLAVKERDNGDDGLAAGLALSALGYFLGEGAMS